jgi:hypothetical protein
MAQIQYNLYRVKMIRPPQSILFESKKTPEQLLLSALKEKPSVELRKNYIWHIGNITMLNDHQGYFAVGRTTLTTVAKFDNSTGNFLDEPSETSPYTHVVFDSSLGVIAIAKKPLLAPTTKGLASTLERLLQTTVVTLENELDVEIDIIPDPTGFIQHVKIAHAVKKFTASFTGPNPFDADEFFQKPLSVYAGVANASEGKASISGEDLDKGVVIEVAKSTAATGNKASARVQQEHGKRPITVNMSGDPVKMVYEEEDHTIKTVVKDMVSEYNRVRH